MGRWGDGETAPHVSRSAVAGPADGGRRVGRSAAIGGCRGCCSGARAATAASRSALAAAAASRSALAAAAVSRSDLAAACRASCRTSCARSPAVRGGSGAAGLDRGGVGWRAVAKAAGGAEAAPMASVAGAGSLSRAVGTPSRKPTGVATLSSPERGRKVERSTLHAATIASRVDPASSLLSAVTHMSESLLQRTSATSKQRTGSHPQTLRTSSPPAWVVKGSGIGDSGGG